MKIKAENLLNHKEQNWLVDCIRKAELLTTGEIRVHLEDVADINSYDRAAEVFAALHMHNTNHRNGVLIYVAVADHTFVIYGDKGINDVVSKDFWNDTKNIIQEHFKHGHFKQGLVEGILKAGQALETYFPWHHTDVNELPNDISKG